MKIFKYSHHVKRNMKPTITAKAGTTAQQRTMGTMPVATEQGPFHQQNCKSRLPPADCHTFSALVNTAEDTCRLQPALLRYSQLIPRSPPALPSYPHQTAWLSQASSSTYPTLKR